MLPEKMENDNLYNKIQELFGNIPGNFSILEEQIDLDLQMEYFETSKSLKNNVNNEETLRSKDDIFDQTRDSDETKELLVRLAAVEDVEAYRTIEKYLENPDDSLRDWAILAYQESRMNLESKLLDENQVFISTGLGGKNDKLRYFIVLLMRNEQPFSPTQEKVVRNEMSYILKKSDAEVEEISFHGRFATMLALVPLEIPLQDLFDRAINECNGYGDFLNENFVVTNVKKLSVEEVDAFIKKRKLEELEGPDELDEDELI